MSTAEFAEEMAKRKDHIAALFAEMTHHAIILTDRYLDNCADDIDRSNYLAARERWEVAVAEHRDATTQAVTDNALAFLRTVHPSRLTLLQGGAE